MEHDMCTAYPQLPALSSATTSMRPTSYYTVHFMFYVLKGMAFLSIVLRIYFRYLQMYSGDSRCIRYQDSR